VGGDLLEARRLAVENPTPKQQRRDNTFRRLLPFLLFSFKHWNKFSSNNCPYLVIAEAVSKPLGGGGFPCDVFNVIGGHSRRRG